MKLLTWNVNGLRAAIGKGFSAHVARHAPDVAVLQEIRCTADQLPAGYALPAGPHALWNHATSKKGYSGTLAFGDFEPVQTGFEGPDPDGRIVQVRRDGVRILGCYLPSGSAGPESQARKDDFLIRFAPYLRALATADEPVLVCGDLNIAPTPLDVHAPKRSEGLAGYLPHERAWFAEILTHGFVDVVREAFGATPGPWTWWSNFGRARIEDRGWRIDHVLANRAAAKLVTEVTVDRSAGIACSDHAPIVVQLGKRRGSRPPRAVRVD